MMRGGGGSVVNIASISGLRASTLRVAYGTSKAALIHLTKQQAVELGNAGIRVNAVAPGPVDTEMAKLVHSVAIRSDYYDAIPLNRYGTTEEIAQAVGWLCSARPAIVNGQVLAVDGGFDAAGVGRRLRRHATKPRIRPMSRGHASATGTPISGRRLDPCGCPLRKRDAHRGRTSHSPTPPAATPPSRAGRRGSGRYTPAPPRQTPRPQRG
jgi:hypothetical protein